MHAGYVSEIAHLIALASKTTWQLHIKLLWLCFEFFAHLCTLSRLICGRVAHN